MTTDAVGGDHHGGNGNENDRDAIFSTYNCNDLENDYKKTEKAGFQDGDSRKIELKLKGSGSSSNSSSGYDLEGFSGFGESIIVLILWRGGI